MLRELDGLLPVPGVGNRTVQVDEVIFGGFVIREARLHYALSQCLDQLAIIGDDDRGMAPSRVLAVLPPVPKTLPQADEPREETI